MEDLPELSSDEDEFPEGDIFPLNSRRIKGCWIQRIAEALELPGRASLEETRQIIEGKLMELQYQPQNVQVIVQGKNDGAAMFLVNETGVIKCIESCDESAHVLDNQNGNARGAPQAFEREQWEDDDASSEATLELKQAKVKIASLETELRDAMKDLTSVKALLAKEKEKSKRLWQQSCERYLTHEDEMGKKDIEIEELREQVTQLLHPTSARPLSRTSSVASVVQDVGRPPVPLRIGKAPPVDPYTGEDPEVWWEDWLPTFERAASWNKWTDEEKVIQLAGHLRQKALLEWNLIDVTDRDVYERACKQMQARLDLGGKAVAAQDFRHTVQGETELVADFVRQLERVFRRAYGRDRMSTETKETLLYGQLHEGLRYSLMKAPAVSGANTYQELGGAAKSEERCQRELIKR